MAASLAWAIVVSTACGQDDGITDLPQDSRVQPLRVTGAITSFTTTGRGNRPPSAVRDVQSRTVSVGGKASAALDNKFKDPDGDALTYSATTSDSAVATASTSRRKVTVKGVAVGEATITVTATDPGGLTAQLTFGVTVRNRAPEQVRDVQNRTVSVGGKASAALDNKFKDPDGDALTYSATTSDSAVATASTSRRKVTVKGVAVGEATITVTATDPGGLTAQLTFGVTVSQVSASVVVSPATAEMELGDTLRLAAEALDANGSAIPGAQFAWSSGEVSVATVNASGLVEAVGVGAAVVTVTSGRAKGSSQIRVNSANPDRAVLRTFYEATGGVNWSRRDNWLTDAPLADWWGVSVDAGGRVSSLILDNNNLTGTIPAELGVLPNLKRLRLANNKLTGAIPADLGKLDSLNSLALAANQFTGTIPSDLGKLTQLRYLELQFNRLTGAIPADLGKLAQLQQLHLRNNQLTGSIPSELGNLAYLKRLELQFNRLTGMIPTEFGDLANLEILWVLNNELTGPLPRDLLRLTELRWIRWDGNRSLCAPGTPGFVKWLETKVSRGSFCNESDQATLNSLYEAVGGEDWTQSAGWQGDAALSEWYGVDADSLGHVVTLDLSSNGLAGELPSSLGNLANLTKLRIGGNELSGPLPVSLTRLSLRELRYADTDLCVPAEEAVQTWVNSISTHEGTGKACGSTSDREILEALYDATGGPQWTRQDNWKTDAALGEWHGVTVDANDRVTKLLLVQNGLAGPIPPELGRLSELRELILHSHDLHSNGLTGPIPPELGGLAQLKELDLSRNRLSGNIPAALGALANLTHLKLHHNELHGVIPSELGNLDNLRILYLRGNALAGAIPSELGQLGKLNDLRLGYNRLSSIPSELGDLDSLAILLVANNQVTRIPRELGDLTELLSLNLSDNQIGGSIPSELGRLAKLVSLNLGNNRIGGSIPSDLGKLDSLKSLKLADNQLTGAIPAKLGELARLERLGLSNNDLTGSLPPELGGLHSLQEMTLLNNAGLSGPVPSSFTGLSALTTFAASGTGLCAPSDADFQAWLKGLKTWRVAICSDDGDAAFAYLTQAVQSPQFPVPLVAAEPALLRVFMTATRSTSKGIPAVRATFYVDGAEAHVAEIPATTRVIPTEVDEGDLTASANAEIPASVIQPGLEMVIEIDPEGTLAGDLGVADRIPETGRLPVAVNEMPTLDLTLIPFLWRTTPDSAIIETIREMAEDPAGHDLFWDTRTLLPVRDLGVTAHEPVFSDSNDVFTLLAETKALRTIEGGTGHYMGMLSGRRSGDYNGAAGDRVSVSVAESYVIAHELGHNFSLSHAPCGRVASFDPLYPHADGSIGNWGYDFRDGGALVPPTHRDLMSYCNSRWISGYHFSKAARYRVADVAAASFAADGGASNSLLLWGGVDASGQPFLEPAFVVDAPAALPQPGGGEYELSGRTSDGEVLFSLNFDMPEIADGDGSSAFAFALPAQADWERRLVSVTLSGPGGATTLDGDTDRPMVILRNPRSGQVRGFVRKLPSSALAGGRVLADAVSHERGLEALFSRGLPDPGSWRR